MKSLLVKLSIVLFALSTLFTSTEAQANTPETQIILSSNQTIVYFMYSNDKGSYVLNPLAEYENVILIPKKQAIKAGIYNLHHGTKLVATFDEEYEFELEEIVSYSKFEKMQKEQLQLLKELGKNSKLKDNQHIAIHKYEIEDGCVYMDDEGYEVVIYPEMIEEIGATEKDKLLITLNENGWEIDNVEIFKGK